MHIRTASTIADNNSKLLHEVLKYNKSVSDLFDWRATLIADKQGGSTRRYLLPCSDLHFHYVAVRARKRVLDETICRLVRKPSTLNSTQPFPPGLEIIFHFRLMRTVSNDISLSIGFLICRIYLHGADTFVLTRWKHYLLLRWRLQLKHLPYT